MMSRRRRNDLRDQIFGNELLLEHILSFVILKGKDPSPPNVQTCRLVHSSWLQAVNKCLRVARKPLFTLKLEPLPGSPQEEKNLQHFDDMCTNLVRRPGGPFPPTFLSLDRDYTKRAGLQGVARLLSRVGSGLVKLHLQLADTDHRKHVSKAASNFTFPVLQDLTVTLNCHSPFQKEQVKKKRQSAREIDVVHRFLQAVLKGSSNLQNLSLSIHPCSEKEAGFPKFSLPASLTNLLFGGSLVVADIAEILSGPLPRLTTIGLPGIAQDKNNLISPILERLGGQLKNLTFHFFPEGVWDEEAGGMKVRVQLPCLPALQHLTLIRASSFRTDGEVVVEHGEKKFPSLKSVHFENCRFDVFRDWTEKCHFATVEKLQLDVDINDEFVVNMGYVLTCLMSIAFPNVRVLHLSYDATYGICGLQGVFSTFTELTEFRLCLSALRLEGELTADDWTSVLGVGEKECRLKELWDSDVPEGLRELYVSPSIINLTELRRLELAQYRNRVLQVLPVDALFQDGLMKMSKLEEVHLSEEFQVSAKVAAKWRKMGRVLEIET